MEIRIKNVGIIEDSSLQLDGLTIITGRNNSGKTTVGKILYSMIDAVSDIQQKAELDKLDYMDKQLGKAMDTLVLFKVPFLIFDDYEEQMKKYPVFVRTLNEYIDPVFERNITSSNTIIELIGELKELENTLLLLDWFEQKPFKDLISIDRHRIIKEKDVLGLEEKDDSVFLEKENKNIKYILENARKILEKTLIDVKKDPMLVDYTRESINQTLKVEFANQIQSVSFPKKTSRICVNDDQNEYFNFKVENNEVVNEDRPVYTTMLGFPYQKAYLIDDPFILDSIAQSRIMGKKQVREQESFLNENRFVLHNFKLLNILKEKSEISIFEKTVIDDSLKLIKNKIDSIMPGTYEFNSEGEYYVVNNAKLRLSNLATGSKMFSIIKILLEKGCLNEKCMLILDEPEAHLHPEWQNVFAELIVLLVKELKVNVVLTTHSPNFLLALDANMRKYKINDLTNFYKTKKIEETGLVKYECMNDDLEGIYGDFTVYLSKMKMLRDKYFHMMGDEND